MREDFPASAQATYFGGMLGPTLTPAEPGSSAKSSDPKAASKDELRQARIDRLVAEAYGRSGLTFRILDVLQGQEVGDADVVLEPIDLDVFSDYHLNDESLAEHLGLDSDEDQIADDLRAEFARDALQSWISEPDADAQEGAFGIWFTDSSGRKALVCYSIKGYSFSGITIDDVGVFKSEEELIAHYRKAGCIFSPDEVTDEELMRRWSKA